MPKLIPINGHILLIIITIFFFPRNQEPFNDREAFLYFIIKFIKNNNCLHKYITIQHTHHTIHIVTYY